MTARIIVGDCLVAMQAMPTASADAIVTDPPYGLNFMGKRWDYDVPSVEIWAECLRVLKPGGHLLAFAGTRTQHRMAVRIEDAGFEIRDMIAWVYGSGFPKSHNGEWGGTALKPALEPITMARKPLIGTVEANWSAYSVGGLNIDSGRVGDEPGRWPANLIHDGSDDVLSAFPDAKGQQGDLKGHSRDRVSQGIYGDMKAAKDAIARGDKGSAARFFYCAKASKADRDDGLSDFPKRSEAWFQTGNGTSGKPSSIEITKGPRKERANNHPTVKPTDLMRYLCRLVTPPNGLVLDPFMGSGSTGRGAVLEGFRFVGVEREAEYAIIAEARINAVMSSGRVVSEMTADEDIFG